jgi:alpha-glucosidase
LTRRLRDSTWYVGTMNDGLARTVAIPLRFLGRGKFAVESYSDDLSAVPAARQARLIVTASDVIQARLAPAGGQVMRITPSAVASPRR